MPLSPQEIAAQWKKSLGAATDKIKKKVMALTENPLEQAASQQDLMRAKILEAIDNGTWANNLRAVPFQTWKAAMTGKGLQNLQSGLTDGEAKVVQFQTLAAPVFEQAKQAAKAIAKDGTVQTALRKVEAAINAMKTLKGRMKGR